jgi:Ser/Thr protein kinase RdoA (MazF antagonist)
LPGEVLEVVQLPREQELVVWRDAGNALAKLHESAVGEFFGPLNRDGTPAGPLITGAVEWMEHQFADWLERGEQIGALRPSELRVVDAAHALLSAFQGERPIPCHRDYCSANWLVTPAGGWAGVIDFEFSYWDVRAADFTRYPEWSWIDRPDRIEAFFNGYGRVFTPAEEQQRLVSLVLYALGALVWGEENDYHGFAAEGRRALGELTGIVGSCL